MSEQRRAGWRIAPFKVESLAVLGRRMGRAMIPNVKALEQFIACAAYGETRYFYFPTAEIYAEGGYDPTRDVYTPAIEA